MSLCVSRKKSIVFRCCKEIGVGHKIHEGNTKNTTKNLILYETQYILCETQ